MKEITFTPSALRQWVKLPAALRGRIQGKLESFGETGMGDVKRLQGRYGLRLRVGDYRVIMADDGTRLIVVAVGHRRDIYD